MAEKNNLYSFYAYIGEQFNKISEIADKIGEYKEFKEKYSELLSKKEADGKIWDDFLTKFYARVLEDWAKWMIDVIKSRETSGQSFAEIIHKLSEHIKKLQIETANYTELSQTHKDIEHIRDEAREKLKIERYERKERWKERIISFILGVVGAYLLWRFGFS